MPENVRDRLTKEAAGQYDPINAVTVLKSWATASKPVLVACSDGEQYVIKGSQNGKMVYNEYVCGRLGQLLGASVAWLRFVEIDPALRTSDPRLGGFGPGLAMGSLRIPTASERAGIQHIDVPQNRPAFAGLAVLYSWIQASDHQLIYQETPPQLVCSSDHGHFFPHGPNWTPDTLNGAGSVVRDPFFSTCALTTADFVPFWPRLTSITDAEIKQICSAPPSEWGVPDAERSALANYLISRRAQVQAAF